MTADAYPLQWPTGRTRTSPWSRKDAKFRITFAVVRDEIVQEVKRLCGWRYRDPDIVISTNVPLRKDGLPLAGQRAPEDPGVAVYFEYKGKQVCFACDCWKTVADNMQGICKTIEALRGISRWGTGDMMEAAFTGFALLDAPDSANWRATLGIGVGATLADAREAYRRKAAEHHPDRGGDSQKMSKINAAWQQAQANLS